MKVATCMSQDVRLADPEDTLQSAAQMMAQIDSGVLPVRDHDRLIGMITDRDIAVRAIAQGLGPTATVGEVMSPEVLYCYEDQDIEEVLRNMADIKVRRLPVLNREKRLVGIVSLGDLAAHCGSGSSGEALTGISQPGGEHSQIH